MMAHSTVRVGSKTEQKARSSVYCRKLTVTAMLVLSPSSWWRSIVVRPPVLPACLSYPALDWQLAV